eukprot:GHUV01049750.1.p1 GENE.GHUV01049750.1~~GHUV01049750.1.p1  ORF type:complete len:207 (+),score=37.41 GHUV01049750.1:149-769(+)
MQALAVCGYVAPDPAYDKTGTADIDSQVDASFTFGAVSDNPKSIAMSAPTAVSPIGRAEWLRYVSLFFNKEWEAETLVRSIRNDYNSLKRAAQSTAAAQGTKPVVAWIYKGFSADFVVSKAPYKVAYVEVCPQQPSYDHARYCEIAELDVDLAARGFINVNEHCSGSAMWQAARSRERPCYGCHRRSVSLPTACTRDAACRTPEGQ